MISPLRIAEELKKVFPNKSEEEIEDMAVQQYSKYHFGGEENEEND